MAKLVQVSDDAGASWKTLPGGSGELSKEGSQLSDTIFGQTFESNESGLIQWSVSANALFKGFAGYQSKILKQGTSTATTAEATTLVSGKTYQVDDLTKRIMDRATAITVLDGASDETANVLSVDWLFGKVTFLPGYTVLGAITIDYNFFPTTQLGKGRSFTLTMQTAAIDDSDFATVQANSGHMTSIPGLRTVGVDLTGVEDLTGALDDELVARNELIIEIDAVGDGLNIARGFFKVVNYGQSGDVGALEEESVTFVLNVPIASATNNFNVDIPFGWQIGATSTLSDALQIVLTAWETETAIDIQYLSDGTNGDKGDCVVTETTMSTGLDAMVEFNLAFSGVGVLTAVP